MDIPQTTSRPLSVKVIVIVMLASAVAGLGFSEGDAAYFVGGVLLFALLYGLWYMRRWALYLFTFFVILRLAVSVYEYLTGEIKDLKEFLSSVLPVPLLMLTYLWSHASKFH